VPVGGSVSIAGGRLMSAPDGWPSIDGAPVTLEQLIDIAARAEGWARQVDELGVDAPPIPLSVEERAVLREMRVVVSMAIGMPAIERFLEDES
jgi:hypothetical protein